MEEQKTMPSTPPVMPISVSVEKPKSSFGSLVIATLVGAGIAVTLLYLWGAEVAHEIQASVEQSQ